MPLDFDLNLARQGHPLCTRDGQRREWIAQSKDGTVIVQSDSGCVLLHQADGVHPMSSGYSLMLADLEPVEETAWINLFACQGSACIGYVYPTKAVAQEISEADSCVYAAVAVPVTIKRPGVWRGEK